MHCATVHPLFRILCCLYTRKKERRKTCAPISHTIATLRRTAYHKHQNRSIAYKNHYHSKSNSEHTYQIPFLCSKYIARYTILAFVNRQPFSATEAHGRTHTYIHHEHTTSRSKNCTLMPLPSLQRPANIFSLSFWHFACAVYSSLYKVLFYKTYCVWLLHIRVPFRSLAFSVRFVPTTEIYVQVK